MIFDTEFIVRCALPTGRLWDVFEPLRAVAPRSAIVEWHSSSELAYLDGLKRRLESRTSGDDRELAWLAVDRRDLELVFSKYRKHLPLRWVEMLEWAHWVAMNLLPPELPALRHAFEALIEIEPQLHVDGYHPNRDHVVHQIGDACLAAELFDIAVEGRPGFDNADWKALETALPETRAWRGDPVVRERVVRAGLALAGLVHDIGYVRYIGATARERLSNVFGVPAPTASLDPWEIARVFSGTLLDVMLHDGGRSDSLVVDLYRVAWMRAHHGPLSAFVLASLARSLRLEGRADPQIDAVLQIAVAAAFLHELHPDSARSAAAPRCVQVARRRIRRFAWPGLFRIVDDLQCWFRPWLVSTEHGVDVDLGARGCSLVDRTLRIEGGARRVGKREADGLIYLADHGGLGHVFDTLAIDKVDFVVSDRSQTSRGGARSRETSASATLARGSR